jgi:hypothetical protein
MQNLIVAMVRFSTAVTLYGYEQLQSAYEMSQKGADLLRNADRLEGILNSLSDSLVERLDPSKQDTLRSFTGMARDAVSGSFSSVGTVDPRALLRTMGDLVQKSADAMSSWAGKAEEAEPAEPVPAAEALGAEQPSNPVS